MFSFLRSTAPPILPNTRVVPCTGVDVARRDLIITTGLVLDARLDAEKLETTLNLLIAKKFPRAGARWVKTETGAHQLHIPLEFNEETPALAFTTYSYDQTYAADPTQPSLDYMLSPSQFYGARPAPFVGPPTTPEFYALFRASSCPTTASAFMNTGIPLLHVHVALFTDMTLLGVTAAHILLDEMGKTQLIAAWTQLLNGTPLDDILGMPWDASLNVAPIAPFTRPKPGLVTMLSFVLRSMWRVWMDPVDELRFLCVPKAYLMQRKEEITEELKTAGAGEWVGSSDVLFAWWLKEWYSTDIHPATRAIYPHITLDARDQAIFASEPGQPPMALETPYIGNVLAHIPVPPLSVADIRSLSLSALSLRLRRANKAYTGDPTQPANDLGWRIANAADPQLPCPPNAGWEMKTNWRKEKLGELDFSGACASGGTKTDVRVRFVAPWGVSRPSFLPRGFVIVPMEDEEVVWMALQRGSRAWSALRRAGMVEFLD